MTQQAKTYLVTGGAGFIGSHLVESLLATGHRVFALDDLSTGRAANLDAVRRHPNFHLARAGVTDAIVLDRLASQSDIVIHLAAAVGVKLIVNHPVETIEINVNGTEAVLKAALHYDCRIVIASTSEVYGKGSRIPFAEDDDVLLGSTMKSRWSYAASKMIDEFLALAYHAEFGLPVTILRLFNTVGPRQRGRYGMVVPRLVAQALAGEPMTVYGTGEQRRCFCDVRDVVEAILGLADHREAIGRVFNIGSTEETTILSLAERVRELADRASSIRRIPYDRAYPPGFEDMQRRVPDTSRIHGLLGWTPRRRLDEILAGVIEAHRGKQPMIGSPPEQMVSRELLSR